MSAAPNRTAVAPHRRAMIAKIHVAKKTLGMVEDDYREVLLDVTGETSLTDCSDAQLNAVIERMKALGFTPMPGKAKGNVGQRAADHPMARKARALWISLYQLGAVRNPSEKALEAFAKRQLKAEKLQWANQSQGFKLIEALKDIGLKNGWDASGASVPILQRRLCEAILKKLVERDAANRDWSLADAAYRLTGERVSGMHAFTSEEYTRLAAALGTKLRETGQ
jgi:phage gp16-like protein